MRDQSARHGALALCRVLVSHQPKSRNQYMKKPVLISAAFLAAIVPSAHAAESFASAVISYSAGTGAGGFTNPAAALGKPAAETGFGPFTPFNPHFGASQIVRVGEGGHLTVQLSNYVVVDNAPGVRELGIWENVGLTDIAYPNGTANTPASVFGADSAVVEVSGDNVTWHSLNGGAPVLFNLPGNYYANSTGAFAPAPASPILADFGKPFTGTLSAFDGQTYPQVLATLDGSAGGTWLDIDAGFGLTQVGYVRFSGVAAGQTLEIDAIGINGSLIGAVVPEPGVGALFAAAGLFLGSMRRHRHLSARVRG
jgi:hypothetical protein